VYVRPQSESVQSATPSAKQFFSRVRPTTPPPPLNRVPSQYFGKVVANEPLVVNEVKVADESKDLKENGVQLKQEEPASRWIFGSQLGKNRRYP
jgi:hypothetical protein